jgi:uncharacterized protein YpmB
MRIRLILANQGKNGEYFMRKSTLFISTALTIFMLVVMVGAVSAYQNMTASQEAVVVEATTEPVVEQVALVEQAPVLPAVVSPEQATTVAVEFMGDTDVYSVEVVDYEGTPAFLVTFSSGKLVYVSPTGEILSITEVEPVVVMAAPPPKKNNNGNSNNNSSSGEHEDHDDHEDHEDHDD